VEIKDGRREDAGVEINLEFQRRAGMEVLLLRRKTKWEREPESQVKRQLTRCNFHKKKPE